MRAIGWLRRNAVELGWTAFAAANIGAMVAWPSWETIPFHFVWISLTIVYGFRVWGRLTWVILGCVVAATGASIFADAFDGIQLWGELFEVPLMSAMFLAMVWHARRRLEAVHVAERTVDRQEAFLHDVSHELRTPVTIARGHLELLLRKHQTSPELRVTLDELWRIERIIDRLLLLAKAEQPGFLSAVGIELEPFLADVFLRWSGIATRVWKLDVAGAPFTVHADPEALREALDALIENAVKYSETNDAIELRASLDEFDTVIEVVDTGCGIAPEALDRIFDRFARADEARNRALGGVGLGLAIVARIVAAHGGTCSAASSPAGSVFTLRLPTVAGGGERSLEAPLAAAVPA